MIDVKCSVCGEDLYEPGGLVFSPPDNKGICKKNHLCKKCYDTVSRIFLNIKEVR